MERKKEIITYSKDGEVPCASVDFVDLEGHDPKTSRMISEGHVEVIAERFIKRVPEWSVIVRRVKQAAPVVGAVVSGITAGVAVYEVIKHLKRTRVSHLSNS